MSRGLSIVVPDSAVIPERHAQAPVPGTLLGSHNPDCYGCGASHPAGLHLTAYSGEGDSVNDKEERYLALCASSLPIAPSPVSISGVGNED